MILDNLNKLELYLGLNPHFGKVRDFLLKTDLDTIGDGKYFIDADNAFVMVADHNLKKEADAAVEAHDKYIDIQIVIKGHEKQGWIARDNCREVSKEMDREKDVMFFADRPTAVVDLHDGQMAVYFPWDGHAPLIGEGTVRKAIVKVAVK